MENSTTFDKILATKLDDAKKNIETLRWRFNQLKEISESKSGSWAQFEDILEQMA